MATVQIVFKQWPEEPLCFGERVRGLRDELGLSREAVSKDMGVKASTIRDIENSIYDPSWPTFLKVAKYYGVSLDWLAGLE
jgi:transcriptional regulator with XRE-family HTH domain